MTDTAQKTYFNPENHLDLSGVDLPALAKAAYAMSNPQGLGLLHYQAGELSDEDAAACIHNGFTALAMDYVHGRAVKLTVYRDTDGRLYMMRRWYDHSDFQLAELLKAVGINRDLAP